MFDYTNPDFITANQRGEITSEQCQMVLRSQGNRLGLAVILIVGTFIFSICLTGYLGFVSHFPNLDTWFYSLIGICCVLITLAFIVHVIKRNRLTKEISASLIEYADGVIRWNVDRYIVDTHSGALPYDGFINPIIIIGHSLSLPSLAPGEYRFYYLSKTRWLLSAKMLNDSES